MATVYEAYDPHTDRTIALKILKAEQRTDEALVRRFLEEARAAGALSHPNIVAYYDVGTEGDVPYITLEMMRGLSLEQLLAEETRLDFETGSRILTQIADALDHAHDLGRVHRDVKPSNILLTENLGTAKLTDFGVARVERADALAATRVGEIIGTPRYMSPEQIDGSAVDGRTDLFCLGVVAYETLTGTKAFKAESLPALLAQISRNDPVPIDELAPDLPPEAAHAVHRMMAKAPHDRWPSGKAFAAALIGSAGGRGYRRQDVDKDARNPLWPRLPALAAGALGVMALGALLWLFLAPIPPDETFVDIAEPSEDLSPEPAPERIEAAPDEPEDVTAGGSLPPLSGSDTVSGGATTTAAMARPSDAWPGSWSESWLRVPAGLSPDTCHWLERGSDGGAPKIMGIASDEAVRSQLIASLGTSTSLIGVKVEIEPQESLICRLVQTLAGRALPAPDRMVRLEPDVDRMVEGDRFKILIEAPTVDSHVSVHYLNAEGMVYTLFPSTYQTATLVEGGARLSVASLENFDEWEVSPPLGREAVLLLAGVSAPLLRQAGDSETIGDFVQRLDAALGSAGEASRPLASLLVLETSRE